MRDRVEVLVRVDFLKSHYELGLILTRSWCSMLTRNWRKNKYL